MAVCDGVEAAEVRGLVGGEWKMLSRYTPGQFDADGNFVEHPADKRWM